MSLTLITGHYSSKGNKEVNQDRCKMHLPDPSADLNKGAVAAIADGISSSQVSQYASDLAVGRFCDEYLNCSELWSPARAGRRILETINLQLLSKTQNSQYQDNFDSGYVCTFSAVIVTGDMACIFNCGDSSVFHVHQNQIQTCTASHRSLNDEGQQYLNNALGIRSNLQLDVDERSVANGDYFILATDGISEYIPPEQLKQLFDSCDTETQLQQACQHAAELALANGSTDNLTVQVIKVLECGEFNKARYNNAGFLPLIAEPKINALIDSWKLTKQLYHSDRSSVFLVEDMNTKQTAVMKIPSVSLQEEQNYLDELAKEEWLMAKLNHAAIIKPLTSNTQRNHFYTLTEQVNGITLRQWLNDNEKADLLQIRAWLNQLVPALQAMHSKGILHQDLRPENIMIDTQGNLTIIDLGSASLHGQQFMQSEHSMHVPGDLLYAAPEYFVGYWPDASSDMFALALIIYHALSGQYPYGTLVAKLTNVRDLAKLHYTPLAQHNINVPVWVDATLKKACKGDMHKRYQSLSEFLFDMHTPNPTYSQNLPFIDRNPVTFWRNISIILLVCNLYLIYLLTL